MNFDPRKFAKNAGSSRPRIVAGEVYLVSDELLVYPTNRERIPHETPRRVIVLQDEAASAYHNLQTLLIAPCSASAPAGPFDHDYGEVIPNGFTKAPTVFVSLLQPICRADLGKKEGTLLPDELSPLMDLAAQLLGWASPLKV